MTPDRINADFAERVVLDTNALPWIGSPEPGVERRMLDRIGGEVARATSIVRYAAGSAFGAHTHGLGEEFLVLSGVFSDELGDYPAGTYVRNPPDSRHAPRCDAGCVIFVKLRQMRPDEASRVVVDTNAVPWQPGMAPGLRLKGLYADPAGPERVALERLAPGKAHPSRLMTGGEEILVLQGELSDEAGCYRAGTWIRLPAGTERRLTANLDATYWVKRGHLPPGMEP